MKEKAIQRKEQATCDARLCDGKVEQSRRHFLACGTCALVGAIAASGMCSEDLGALPISVVKPTAQQGAERTYPIPESEAVNIDRDNDIILVRSANRVYAFSLACPHENTALRWRQQNLRFQCPRHESKYRPDGTFISGRATRNMDRFAIRKEGQNVIVSTGELYRSDEQKADWDAAVVVLARPSPGGAESL